MTEQREPGSDVHSDAALIAAVRRGDTHAYGLLYERHLAAAKRAANHLVATSAEREDLVAEAFTRVLQVLRSGRGPSHDFRPYLLVTMRHAAINATRRGPAPALYGELPDAYLRSATDDPVDARLHGNEAATAFAGLPERWRVVLWHTEVEGSSPAAIAPILGMTPNGVAALAYRAREGLRQAYLRQHLPTVNGRDCRAATDKLAGWVRRSISAPQRRKITAHLDRCERCRGLAADLTEVNGELQAALTAILLAPPAASSLSWLFGLKSALTAATSKAGTAAAITAITAVTAVASQPSQPLGPHGGIPFMAGPPAGLSTITTTIETSARTHVSGRSVRWVPAGAEEPPAAPTPAKPANPPKPNPGTGEHPAMPRAQVPPAPVPPAPVPPAPAPPAPAPPAPAPAPPSAAKPVKADTLRGDPGNTLNPSGHRDR